MGNTKVLARLRGRGDPVSTTWSPGGGRGGLNSRARNPKPYVLLLWLLVIVGNMSWLILAEAHLSGAGSAGTVLPGGAASPLTRLRPLPEEFWGRRARFGICEGGREASASLGCLTEFWILGEFWILWRVWESRASFGFLAEFWILGQFWILGRVWESRVSFGFLAEFWILGQFWILG
jgi:hypothetical protein